MRLERLSGVAAIIIFATMATASAAPIIDASIIGLVPLTTYNVGTASVAGYQNSTAITNPGFDNISSITFNAGVGPPLSGVYAGSTGVAASIFPLGTPGSSLAEYFAVEPNGSVTITFSSPQTTLDLLWGTVDISPSTYNVLTTSNPLNGSIDGANIATAAGIPAGSTGDDNAWVEITGLSSFTSATFTASELAFEFDIGEPTPDPVPEPASLAIFGAGLLGLGWFIRSRLKRA